MRPAPGLKNHLIAGLVHFRIVTLKMKIDPCPIDRRVEDGESLPLAGGVEAVHAPGHCLGQLCFLWPQHGGVLFAADACGNEKSLELSIAYEDIEEGKRSLRKLSRLTFEHALFGHGKPIVGGADRQFRQVWGV